MHQMKGMNVLNACGTKYKKELNGWEEIPDIINQNSYFKSKQRQENNLQIDNWNTWIFIIRINHWDLNTEQWSKQIPCFWYAHQIYQPLYHDTWHIMVSTQVYVQNWVLQDIRNIYLGRKEVSYVMLWNLLSCLLWIWNWSVKTISHRSIDNLDGYINIRI